MKRVLMPVLLLPLLAACGDMPLEPETAAAPAPVARFEKTNNGTSIVRIGYDTVEFIDCANGGLGELVSIEGVLTIRNHENDNLVTGAVHGKLTLSWAGHGVGLTTGDEYRQTAVTTDKGNLGVGGGQDVRYELTTITYRAPHDGVTFTQQTMLHTKVDANGVAVQFGRFVTSCR